MMKKIFYSIFVFGLITAFAAPLYAGGIINKQNLSAEYIRTISRNAATDAADIVEYNPAGVMQMEDGAYANLGIFYANKDYSNTIMGVEYDQDEPSIVPGLFGVYKQDKWSVFTSFTIPAGGGEVDFKDGNATTFTYGQGLMAGVNAKLLAGGIPAPYHYMNITDQKIEAESVYYGLSLGGAYAISDKLSIAAGLRYVDANKEAKAEITITADTIITSPPFPAFALGLNDPRTFVIDYEQTAEGWGAFFGVNYAATDKLNIGLHYQTNTELEFKTDVNTDDTGMLVDGEKANEDLPGLIGLGISYKLVPDVRLDVSYTYYLEEQADWEGAEDNVINGYDLAAALEITFTPKLRGSIGFMITTTHIAPEDMTYEAPELDADTMCAGFAYDVMENMTINFALIKTDYLSETASLGPLDIKLEKDVTGFGLGIEYKFM